MCSRLAHFGHGKILTTELITADRAVGFMKRPRVLEGTVTQQDRPENKEVKSTWWL